MAEPPLIEGASKSESGEQQANLMVDDDAKSGLKSPASSRGPSRAASVMSTRSQKSDGGKKSRDSILSPTGSNKDNPAADCRNMRRIIAEDPEWSLATVPTLADMCVNHIVANFESKFVKKICALQWKVMGENWPPSGYVIS